MNADQHATDAGRPATVVPMPAETGIARASRGAVELYAQAQAARRRSRALAARHRAAQHMTAETLQLINAARDRTEQIRESWLAASAGSQRYSAYARLQARLASMPVIEQAKGIIMAQCGWPEDQAFDALRRASQRENIKLRDLAARVVAATVHSAPAQRRAWLPPAAAPASARVPVPRVPVPRVPAPRSCRPARALPDTGTGRKAAG
jgi:hypothetical protein